MHVVAHRGGGGVIQQQRLLTNLEETTFRAEDGNVPIIATTASSRHVERERDKLAK